VLIDSFAGRQTLQLVYQLDIELAANPAQIRNAQALTLNPSKPSQGLKGTHGLYGSDEWWASINEGRIPVRILSGRIARLFVAGQDEDGNNTCEFVTPQGETLQEGMYFNTLAGHDEYRVGSEIHCRYAFDEWKAAHPFAGSHLSGVLLEVAIGKTSSTRPPTATAC
jgi:hypothetical protein